MTLKLPDEAELEPKKFLLFNILIMVLVPVLAVFITTGAYVVGLVLGIIVVVGLLILLFIYAGPIVALIALVIFIALCGGGAAAFNATLEGMERVVSFIAMAIPAVMCLILGIGMIKNARSFSERRVVVAAYITFAVYMIAIIVFIISAVMIASDDKSGEISYNTLYGFGMIAPSVARLFYTIFGYKELNS